MRKLMIGFAFLVILGVAGYLRFHRAKEPPEVAYAGNREVTLWSTTAQVRERVATVSFGDRLEVLNRSQDEVQVRTVKGATGWVDDRELLSSELWDTARALSVKAESMPVEARGHTRVLGNLHIEPGRETPRLRQLTKDLPLDLLIRRPVEVPSPNRAAGNPEPVQATAQQKKEDWWFVLAHTPDQGAIAGWMLGRFIELDVPPPLPDYASSAAMRIVAWFELNRVKDMAGNSKPQYLVLGTKGPEGRACDFTQLRVYTWALKHDRYETAFIDTSACGKLPLGLEHGAPPASDITFSFEDLSNITPEKRTYRMQETIVRRARQGEAAKQKRRLRK